MLPLTALRVFEAAARHCNFTRAAEELAMTQSAVSYQIRVLEDRVGAPLFVRAARGVTPTEMGERLARRTRDALAGLRDAYDEAVADGQQTLTISVVPTFAERVLAPQLGHFQVANPDLTVRLDISQGLVDLKEGAADLAIRFGCGVWPGLRADLLLENCLAPMLGPALAESAGGISAPVDLLRLPRVDGGSLWWANWFAASGSTGGSAEQRGVPGLGAQTLDASIAVANQAVAGLSPTLFAAELAAGRLIQPFDRAVPDGNGFWLVYLADRANVPKIRAFRHWIGAAMGSMAPGDATG